jgi:hypothetical protein
VIELVPGSCRRSPPDEINPERRGLGVEEAMAAERAREFVKQSPEQPFEPRLFRRRATYCFVVDGVQFRLELEPGRWRVREEAGQADCTFVCSDEDFVRILRGEQNLVTAALQGRIEFAGDLALAQELVKVLPGPPARREEGPSTSTTSTSTTVEHHP